MVRPIGSSLGEVSAWPSVLSLRGTGTPSPFILLYPTRGLWRAYAAEGEAKGEDGRACQKTRSACCAVCVRVVAPCTSMGPNEPHRPCTCRDGRTCFTYMDPHMTHIPSNCQRRSSLRECATMPTFSSHEARAEQTGTL